MTGSAGSLDNAIAIVGAACRLPGDINGLPELWSALTAGRDLVTEAPADRFRAEDFLDPKPGRPGKSYTADGGFLSDVSGFDTGFFDGISPREASRMDPQQRLLLEMTAEAFDDAGLDAAAFAGSDTAVFVGVSISDYGNLQFTGRNVDPYTMVGAAGAITANRISHAFDLRGASMTVDTACSSALTAVHQACEQLRTGRAGLVIAGGINVILSPYSFIGFSAASMLSPTGRCRPFSADADGFVRAEGGGVVLLKPLAAAVADGDRVHAVIMASGVNNDGRTQGLALPSAAAQEALLREVYDRAGVGVDEIAYLEAHGTGTPAGDPIECEAIGRALGQGRTGGPLPVGSVKSNVGHLESGAGMAGLLKALLVLKHGTIPRSLHAEPLNPDIDFDRWRLRPVVENSPLPVTTRPVVGVNSFGFGGANAHVALTAPPPAADPVPVPSGRELPVLVSARTPEALPMAAARFADRLAGSGADAFYDIAYTATRRRGGHPHRAVVLAADPAAAGRGLHAFAVNRSMAGVSSARAVERGRVAFVFSGNGSQWAGMGTELLDTEPVFAAAVAEVDQALTPLLGWSVLDELRAAPDRSRLDRTEVAQPALFAVQVGLVAALRERGVRPAAVAGHSVGEIAAAHVAGALNLETAALVVAERSRAQQATAGQGRMAAVGLPADEIAAELDRYRGRLELAAVNSGRDVTVAGDSGALASLGAELSAREVFFRQLDLDYAFHSHTMDPIAEPLREALADLRPAPTAIPFVSTVTGEVLDGSKLDADYWWRNVREPVRFAAATETLIADGHDVLVEIGPHPVLRTYLRRLAEGAETPIEVVPTLAREQADAGRVRTVMAHLVAAGAAVDWPTYFPQPGRVVDLPAYPWQRERHWNGSPRWWLRPGTKGDGVDEHPLLGTRTPAPVPAWRQNIEPARLPWLGDHVVDDTVLMPAAAFVEMALAAGRLAHDSPVELTGLEVFRALVLPWDDPAPDVQVQVALSDEDGVVRIASRSGDLDQAQQHARGRVRRLLAAAPPRADVAELRARLPRRLAADQYYTTLARAGLRYGPAFRVLTELSTGDGEVLAGYATDLPADGYLVHPCLLDGTLQAGALLLAGPEEGRRFLPAGFDTVRWWRSPAPTGLIHIRSRSATPHEICWDVTVTDARGAVAMELVGCRLRRFDPPGADAVQRYRTVLRAAQPGGVTEPGFTPPAPGALLAACTPSRDAGRHRDFIRAVKVLTAHHAVQALTEVYPGDEPFTVADLIDAGIHPKHRALLDVLIGLAVAQDLLRNAPEDVPGERRWRFAGSPAPGPLFREMLYGYPEATAVTLAYGRAGRRLADVLQGRCDPQEELFGDRDRHLIESFRLDAPARRMLDGQVRALVRSLVASWPADRPLRILEVGAGRGGLAAVLLPLLPPERTRYVFADDSATVLPAVRDRFATYDFVDYRTLNLDADPTRQGIPAASFDLVVAGDVLHGVRDLPRALARVAELLADGGQLLALESHDPELLAPYLGLLDGFWVHVDKLRAASPLLPAADWPAALRQAGLDGAVQVGSDQEPTGSASSLLLAQRAARRGGHAEPAVPPAADGTGWVLAAEKPDGRLPRALAEVLADLGGHATGPVHAGTEAADWSVLLPPGATDPAVVLLLDDTPPTTVGQAEDRTVRRAAVLRAIAAACDQLPEQADPQLWLVTGPTGAQPGPETPTDPAGAAAWGLARSLANEHPRLRVRRVSLARGGAGDAEQDARRLARELVEAPAEDEIVLTRGGRFVPRATGSPTATAPLAGPEYPPYRLEVRDPGLSHRLVWTAHQQPVPAAGEVAIEVRAAALNYRDVMMALGLFLEPETGTPTGNRIGLECAGVVTAVGPGVGDLAPGDRVFAFAPFALASHVVTRAGLVGRMPADMDFAAATTLPVVFLTVHYGLDYLARLRAGETVLIHSAAGGVGLAALQLAQERGARVIATAGTPAKRDLLRLLGIEHVLDSRTLAFADEVRELTGGQGVDVVLNSLAGEAISRSLELLRPGGRFVELGKRDIYANNPLLLRPFDANLSFFGLNALELMRQPDGPGQAQFAEVVERVQAGGYRPLPYQEYPAARIEEAFGVLRHSRHIGKVVISFAEPPAVERPPAPFRADPRAGYLITGGLSGLGAATARWLADQGAGHLALVSRRGAAAPEAPALLDELRARGIRATAHAADVTDADAMRRIIERMDADGHRLRGVFHAAMQLDDAPLAELSDDRLRAVLAPKMTGAAVLDELTRDRDLDFFVACSSVSALIGNYAQSPYAAANLYLEALARARRAAGRPGLAVAWGAIGDTGYIARNDLQTVMARVGLTGLRADEACQALGELLARDTDVAVIGRFDWATFADYLPAVAVPRLADVVPARGQHAGDAAQQLRRLLATAAKEEVISYIADNLADSVAKVLQTSPDRIDRTRSMSQLGLDSLMAAELVAVLHRQLACDIALVELISVPHLDGLANRVYTWLSKHTETA